MKMRETPKDGYGQGNINTKTINCPVPSGVNTNRGDSVKGGDTGFRQSNGNVKGGGKKPKGMNKNAY